MPIAPLILQRTEARQRDKQRQASTSKRLVPQDVFAGGFMKSLSGTLLALAFVCFTLISLLSVNHTWEDVFLQLGDNESKISELGLRFNLQP
jgi:hypothetical protein